MKNYADREGYIMRLKAGVDNILGDLHDHSHRTKAEFIVLLFMQNISKFLISLPILVFSAKLHRHDFRI